jgi:hypothetical protein
MLALARCGTVSSLNGGYTNAYSGTERPDSEVATIYGHAGLFAKPHSPVVQVSAIDDIHTGNFLTGFYATVKVLPGPHRIELYCFTGSYAYPAFTAELEAGKAYAVQCHVTHDGYGIGSISYATGSISEIPAGSAAR